MMNNVVLNLPDNTTSSRSHHQQYVHLQNILLRSTIEEVLLIVCEDDESPRRGEAPDNEENQEPFNRPMITKQQGGAT